MEIELREETKEEIGARARQKAVLYDMRLHETTEFKTGAISYFVTRVVGGWIYNHVRLDSGQMNSVFVPWSNEMQ
jgi:hypothetical protein